MGYGDPSEVRDLVVGTIGETTVELKCNDPLQNPLCVDKYSIDYGETNNISMKSLKVKNGGYDNHATISDLQGCTIYDFDVSPISQDGVNGVIVRVTAETLETYPLPIGDISVTYDESGLIDIIWSTNQEDKCQATWKICYHDELNPGDTCFLEDGADGENYRIQINPDFCVKYDVGVAGVSPSGMIGEFSWDFAWTQDAQPGPVQNLALGQVDTNSIEFTYTDPAENANCVTGYDVQITDLNDKSIRALNQDHDDFLTDLEACTEYEISVSAYTRTGLTSTPEIISASTGEGPVSAPRSFGVHDGEVTDTTITLVWYEALTNSRCTGSYTLSWTGSSDGSVVIDQATYQVIQIVEGLTCGGTYDFTLEVFSVNAGASSEGPVTITASTLPC